LRLLLEADGHRINAVEAAEQAFFAITQERPDVILLDMNLPIVDRLTRTRILNADPGFNAIPVVVITSYPDRFTWKDVFGARL
jgi:CheY-like chemotaxis protein